MVIPMKKYKTVAKWLNRNAPESGYRIQTLRHWHLPKQDD
jgi:hypothetical protein